MSRSRLGFIGAGRVAHGLSRAFANAGEPVVAVFSRSPSSASSLCEGVKGCTPVGSVQEVVEQCDIVFLTVPDDSIGVVSASAAWPAHVAAVHCSGAADASILRRDAGPSQCGAFHPAGPSQCGAFHPLLMFADAELAVASLRGAAVAVEAPQPLLAELERLCTAIGSRSLHVPSEARAAYHAASHYAAAFLCVLLAEGEAIFEQLGLDRADGRDALAALAGSALAAARKAGPARAMAGTYSRGDKGTAARHLAALEALDPALLPLYRLLANKSVALALETGRIDAHRAEELRRMLL